MARLFRKRTAEEVAERERQTAERKAERERRTEDFRERLRAKSTGRSREERLNELKALLQPGEEFVASFRTAELLMHKDVLVTSKRVIIALGGDPDNAESILYRSITSLDTGRLVTHDLRLRVQGRKEQLELTFEKKEDRDAFRDLITEKLVTEA